VKELMALKQSRMAPLASGSEGAAAERAVGEVSSVCVCVLGGLGGGGWVGVCVGVWVLGEGGYSGRRKWVVVMVLLRLKDAVEHMQYCFFLLNKKNIRRASRHWRAECCR
jgi:hypothetical protein